MKSKPLRIQSLILLLLPILSLIPDQSIVQAQNSTCSWTLIDEKSSSSTVSTAPDATSSVEGASIQVGYLGLITTHSWTAPGNALNPGQEYAFSVEAAWDADIDFGYSGSVQTNLNFNWLEMLSIRRTQINFNTEESGYVTNSATIKIPSGSA